MVGQWKGGFVFGSGSGSYLFPFILFVDLTDSIDFSVVWCKILVMDMQQCDVWEVRELG